MYGKDTHNVDNFPSLFRFFVKIWFIFVLVMQKLIQNIELLIHGNNFVVIPGFGGFVAETSGAFEVNGTLYPPHKSIGFNSSLTYNDGLLAQQYARTEGVSYLEANNMIAKSVSKMRQMLEQWRHFRFGSIGMFHLTENGIAFEPSDTNTFLSSSYGLVPVHFPKLDIEVKHNVDTVVDSTAEEKNEPVRQHITWGYRVVAAAAVIMLLILFPINISDSRHQPKQMISQASLVATPTINKMQVEPETLIEEEVVADTNNVTYNIIIGSFYSKSKAEQFLRELPNAYKESCHIIISEHRYRVSYKTFSTEAESDEFLETFTKSNPRFADAWILEFTE